jgi:LysM repeat protein
MTFQNHYRQCPQGTGPYTIRAGDTLYIIAARHNTTVQAILNVNPGLNPNMLMIGQQICVPGLQPQPAPGACPPGTAPYTVRAGDVLYRIAAQNNTTVQAILAANPGLDPERLFIGQQICIPGAQPIPPPTTTPCSAGTIPYIIKAGDTLARIAVQYNTTVNAIINVNPGIEPTRLAIGQQICIPRNQPPVFTGCPQDNYYVITAGDTLYMIAQYFNTSVSELLRVNPGINPNTLRVGQAICIPVAPSPVRIEVDTSNFRLTLFRGNSIFRTYPVAIGKPSTPTPLGTWTVVNKQVNPGGPYGTRWMGLSAPHYGIHGTSNPASIGKRASNGCVRMFNNDVNELFNLVPVGTVVRIF